MNDRHCVLSRATRLGLIVWAVTLLTLASHPAARAQARANAPTDQRVELVEFRELPLVVAMRLFSEQTGLNVVPSIGASEINVSLFLQDVTPVEALELLCSAHNLWFRVDEQTGIYQVFTVDEYRRDLLTFRAEETKVFTLLYPNSLDVAVAIRDVFGDRVRLGFGIDTQELTDELEERFERFDILDERSQGIGIDSSRGSSASGSRSSRSRGSASRSSRATERLDRSTTRRQQVQRSFEQDLTPEEIQALEAIGGADSAAAEELADALVRRRASIFVTVIRKHNKLVVRTSDQETMNQITELVSRLDVPTPLVLLEVKVLSIELGDGFQSAFDFQFEAGDFTGGFTSRPLDSANQNLFFDLAGSNFSAQLELLEDENRVTQLATPVLLTANNEVSRLFVGEQVPITIGFSEPRTFVTDGALDTINSTPITELRDVGTTLLITPSVNADRTVTLRILQDTSSVTVDGGEILVPQGDSFVEQLVDIVAQQTVSGTIVAKDGLPVIIGGLIQEGVRDVREQVPVLGDIPLLGMFFRRQVTSSFRSEVVIVIRPYVFSTPAESDEISRRLLEELSVHPLAPDPRGGLNYFGVNDVLGENAREYDVIGDFEFHGAD